MKTLLTAFAAALVGFFAWNLFAQSSRGVQTAHYVIRPDPESGKVGVRLELPPSASGTLLSALLSDRLVNLENLSAQDESGTLLGITPRARYAPTGKTTSRFTCYEIAPSDQAFTVAYSVTPPVRKVSVPCGEERHAGISADSYCYITAASCVLLPVSADGLSFSIEVPEQWSVVSTFPTATSAASVEQEIWGWSFVAGSLHLMETEEPRCSLYAHAEIPSATVGSVRAILAELNRVLGPPRRDLAIALIPTADDLLRLEKGQGGGFIVVDIMQADVGSLRRMIREAVRSWYPATDSVPWFGLGLTEYLAQVVPWRLGLDNSDARSSLEFTWLRERDIAARAELYGKFKPWVTTKAATVLYELDQLLAERGGLAQLTRSWDGKDLPRLASGDADRVAVEGVYIRAAKEAPFVAGFEKEWELVLEEVPEPPADDGEDGAQAKELRILVTANTDGHLENCGCRANESGGLARRVAAIKNAQKAGELLLLDLGNFLPTRPSNPRLDPFVEMEVPLHLDAMASVGYDAICVGPSELLAQPSVAAKLFEREDLVLLGHGISKGGERMFRSMVATESQGKRFGIIGLSEKHNYSTLSEALERNAVGVKFPCGTGELSELVEQLRDEADIVVVIGRFSVPTQKQLCSLGVDIVINGEQASEIWRQPLGLVGETLLVHDYARSYGITDLRISYSGDGRLRGATISRIELPADAERDAEVVAQIDQHYQHVSLDPSLMTNLSPLFAWDDWSKQQYVGAAACQSCHPQEYVQWLGTAHAGAMATLRKRGRARNPNCVRCHVLGLGREDGFTMNTPDAGLEGVQCEACHGAGQDHVRAPTAQNIRLTPPQQVCLECHDDKHSDSFLQRWESALSAVDHR